MLTYCIRSLLSQCTQDTLFSQLPASFISMGSTGYQSELTDADGAYSGIDRTRARA
jgi:hypothetical protein